MGFPNYQEQEDPNFKGHVIRECEKVLVPFQNNIEKQRFHSPETKNYFQIRDDFQN